ncbi:MAG: hypothetical protein ACYDA6_11210 [Solirubrobacteraceae bacterium]
MSEANEALRLALARADARAAAATRVDDALLNRMVRRQQAALTRAQRSGDPERVILTVRDTVREWEAPGALWPDDWSRWQRALDDVLPWHQHIDIRDLR